jgi:hypothetical protein
MELSDDLKEAAIKFIDNGGGNGKPGEDGTPGLHHVTTVKVKEVRHLQIILTKQLFLYKVTEELIMEPILKFKMNC